ncbi:MAG: hypothetical protein PHI48_10050 [Bacteroidales bacterium]|nr:hypothetical protein [Bacteroidales bacterium]MDD4822882.1 hypothetical protein [Bacteroidales bacterium]
MKLKSLFVVMVMVAAVGVSNAQDTKTIKKDVKAVTTAATGTKEAVKAKAVKTGTAVIGKKDSVASKKATTMTATKKTGEVKVAGKKDAAVKAVDKTTTNAAVKVNKAADKVK